MVRKPERTNGENRDRHPVEMIFDAATIFGQPG
jgi:hypothetical protein